MPVNDLLAPPPTVRPVLDEASPLAPLVRRVDAPTGSSSSPSTTVRSEIRPTLQHFEQLGVPLHVVPDPARWPADPGDWKGTVARGGLIESHAIAHPNLRVTGLARAARRESLHPGRRRSPACSVAGPRCSALPTATGPTTFRRSHTSAATAPSLLWTGSTNNGKLTMQHGFLEPGDIILMHYRTTLNADLDDVAQRRLGPRGSGSVDSRTTSADPDGGFGSAGTPKGTAPRSGPFPSGVAR